MKRTRAVNRKNLEAFLQSEVDRLQASLEEMGFQRYPNAPMLQDAIDNSAKTIAAGVAMQIGKLAQTADAFRIYLRYGGQA
jgi:hypothetical protein